ncbi:hypothetical protein CPB84DRAFT_1777327 [Gymnopilus junonius]|uniref:Peptidase S54 rhomboid domain-containing protein n=1 Tax=Gymnopilus junonius TaxID=109634 RepID=A0A9P5NQK7_GYMJU|nr:hypothetical protein CPB84DRAFT_1777327 [Gymnopilus junonius]
MQRGLFRFTSKARLYPGTYSLPPCFGQTAAVRSSIRFSVRIGERPFTNLHRVPYKYDLRIRCMQPISDPSILKRWFSASRSFLRHHVPQHPQRKTSFLGILDKIPSNAIFYGIIGINVAVFTMWFMAIQKYKQEGDPSAVLWMERNFLNSWKNLTSGRIWTPLTACFSHQDWSHILLNGFTFYFMAPVVLEMLGSRQFIFLYMGGGLVASFASMTYAQLTGKYNHASHGASGAIYSVVSLLACAAPKLTFQLYGIIPVPAWLAVAGLFSYDLYSTLSAKNGTTDTVGHIGGMIAGIGYFLMRRFRVF